MADPIKQINIEADFPTNTRGTIESDLIKFIGAGGAGDARATAEEITRAGAIMNPAALKGDLSLELVDNVADADKPVSTAAQAALDLKQDASEQGKVYVIPDVDLTTSGIYYEAALTPGKTFIADRVIVFLKTMDTWSVAPAGAFRIGFSLTADPAANAYDWDDAFCQVLGERTSSFTVIDSLPKDSGNPTGGPFDIIFGVIDTPFTATDLIGDIIISGFEV